MTLLERASLQTLDAIAMSTHLGLTADFDCQRAAGGIPAAFQPYKDVAINICLAPTMLECLLYVPVTACKPMRCRLLPALNSLECTAGSQH